MPMLQLLHIHNSEDHIHNSEDHKGWGMAHKTTSSKNQPQVSLTMMRQYRLGKTKPKQAFVLTQNIFNMLLQNFKIII